MSNIKFPLLQDRSWVRRAAATMRPAEIAEAAAVEGERPGATAVKDAIKRARARSIAKRRYRDSRMDEHKRVRNESIADLSCEGWSDAAIGAEFNLSAGAIRKIRLSLGVEK